MWKRWPPALLYLVWASPWKEIEEHEVNLLKKTLWWSWQNFNGQAAFEGALKILSCTLQEGR